MVAHYKFRFFGYSKTAELFNQLFSHLGHHMSAGTVRNIVPGFNRRVKAAQVRSHHQFPAPQSANAYWCLDFTGKVDAKGIQHMVLGIMDRGRRLCLHLRRQCESSASVIAALHGAIVRFGKPDCVLTDN